MAKRTLHLALIFGGRSAERDVSIATARQIALHLNPEKYRVVPIEILSNGHWSIESPAVKSMRAQQPRLIGDIEAAADRLVPFANGRPHLTAATRRHRIDVAFLALHGPYGEDGTIQGMMEMLNIRYTCSGVLASALAMDKYRTQRLVASAGILVPKSLPVLSTQRSKAVRMIPRQLNFPCVVKPLRLGSSVGVSIVQKRRDLEDALRKAFAYGHTVLVEEYIAGRELTAAILGNEDPLPLPLIEIKPKVSRFFDYTAKYEAGASNEICPAPVPKGLTTRIQRIARQAHILLGCRGVTRSDFILDRKNQPYFLEINTIPGMTQTSLVPQAARQAGISFSQLLDRLVRLALVD